MHARLSNCSLGDAGARSIAGLLRKGYGGEGAAYQPQLTTLDLSDNAIGIEGARALASALALNEHRLEDVSLSGNDDIGDDGAERWAPRWPPRAATGSLR